MSDRRKSAGQGSLRAIDERILHFSQAAENAALRPLTGSFCTPFRGTLFSQSGLDGIQAGLAKRPATALILATNPNIANVGETKFRSMEDHIATGRYGEVCWSAGDVVLGGGVPVKVGNVVIGAVGIGGAPGGNLDEQCAMVALDKVKELLK